MQSFNSLSLMKEAKYEAWRRNLSVLYDVFVRDNLASPSLTVQWLPNIEVRRGGRLPKRVGKLRLNQRLVIGSSNIDEDNNIIIANISFSEKRLKTHIDHMLSNPNPATCFIKIWSRIKHSGIVNRARYMPQNPGILASKSSNGDVYIYDLKRNLASFKPTDISDPILTLKGLTAGGSGMSWNPNRKGYILSCSLNERTIRLFDINSKLPRSGINSGLNKFNRGHPSGVKDCSWHCLHSSLFGSVGNDRNINIWDIRSDFTKMPAITTTGHKSSVNCLSFNYFSDHLLATGSSDQTIALWDLRKMRKPCHRLIWHKAETCKVYWSPNNESILASSGVDERLLIWDISQIGSHQTPDEAEEAPPELIFIHGGHTDNILDFSWNITEPWLLSSVSQDKVIQIWQMGEQIYDNDYSKKYSHLLPKRENPSKCPSGPGSTKSFFSKTSTQTYLESLSLGSIKVTGANSFPNVMEASESSFSANSLKSTSLPVCSPSKSQQSVKTTHIYEETSLCQALPGPSNAQDFITDFQLSSDSSSPSINESEIIKMNSSLPCISPLTVSSSEDSLQTVKSSEILKLPKSPLASSSPLSKSSLEDSSLSAASPEVPKQKLSNLSPLSKSSLEDSPKSTPSPELPQLPTSMESPKSLEYPLTPESVNSLQFSTSEPPTTPESAKSILFSHSGNSERCPESPKDSEDIDNQGRKEAEQLTRPVSPTFSTICCLPECQLCLPHGLPKNQEFIAVSPTQQNPMTSELSPIPSLTCRCNCQDHNYALQCNICFYLKKFSDNVQTLSAVHHPPSQLFPSESAAIEPDNPASLEAQNPLISIQSADMEINYDPLLYLDDLDFEIAEEYVLEQTLQDFPETTPTSNILAFENNTQNSLMLPESYVPTNILNPSNNLVNSNVKKLPGTTDSPMELTFTDFQALLVSPASQEIKKTQDISSYTKEHPNIQYSQDNSVLLDDPVSTNIVDQNLTDIPASASILYSHDGSQNQDMLTSTNVTAPSEVPVFQDLKEHPDGLASTDLYPSDPSIENILVSSGNSEQIS